MQVSGANTIGMVQLSAPSTSSNGARFNLGYDATGTASTYPYMTFNFNTPNMCFLTLGLYISDYSTSTNCGGNLLHGMGMVNPSSWYGSIVAGCGRLCARSQPPPPRPLSARH